MAIPLIIDTDTAQDDCVALLVGLLDPEAELRAITMVAGNVGFDRQVENALMTLSAADRDGEVPVYLGCTRPMMREWVSAEYAHGDGGGGHTVDVDGWEPEAEHGVDALLRLTAEDPGEVSIVAIGPLTNIAMAVVKDPTFPQRVKQLFIMGGSCNARGNITAAAEYNFYVDPEAAQIVFQAGFDQITVLPWDPVSIREGLLTFAEFDELGALGTPVSEFFRISCAATIEYEKSVGIMGSTHPDSLTAAVLLHPELIVEAREYNVQIETSSELTRGYSAMSWGIHDLPNNARVVEKIDHDGFVSYLRGILATKTEPSRPIRAAQ